MKKHILALILATVALSATAEPMRVSIFTPEGELYFLGIFDVTFKPKLHYNKAYSCVAKQDFRPSIVCTLDGKGKKTQGRYCVKPSKQTDLLCSKPLYVESEKQPEKMSLTEKHFWLKRFGLKM